MPTGIASARWRGTPPQGEGEVGLYSGAFRGAFGPPGPGPVHTDPEELLAGALASCFAMALAARPARSGRAAAEVRSDAFAGCPVACALAAVPARLGTVRSAG